MDAMFAHKEHSGAFDRLRLGLTRYADVPMDSRTSHRFGGAWTDEKLQVLEGYLSAYTTALKNTSFRKGYIDAFAGTGYRDAPERVELLPDLIDEEPRMGCRSNGRRLRRSPR